MAAKFQIVTDANKLSDSFVFAQESVGNTGQKYSNTIMTLVFDDVYKKLSEPPFESLQGLWWALDRLWYYSPLIMLALIFYILLFHGIALCCKKPVKRVVKTKTP